MPRISFLLCILFAALSLSAQGLPLFPSRQQPVQLKSKEGTTITAVIHDVLPEQQSARIYIEERRESFIVSFDLFDESSQEKLQDWFYKRLINERVSIRNAENVVDESDSRTPINAKPNAPAKSSSSSTRFRKITSSIYNASPYDIKDLTVVHGVQVGNNSRDTGMRNTSSSRNNLHKSELEIPLLKSRSEYIAETPPIILTSSSSSYTRTVTVRTQNGGSHQEQIRYYQRSADRVSGSYTLIYYKEELVAAVATRNSLVEDSQKYRKRPQQHYRQPMPPMHPRFPNRQPTPLEPPIPQNIQPDFPPAHFPQPKLPQPSEDQPDTPPLPEE